jgi:tetratricopeptide (TPR) repeat protein
LKTANRFLVALLLLFSSPVLGQEVKAVPPPGCTSYLPPEQSQDATALSMRGVECFESNDFLRALIFYRQAYALSKSAVLRAGIGRSLQELGQPDLARQYYEGYLKVASPSTDGYQKIEQRLDAVRETLKTNTSPVVIRSTPGDATVFVVLEGDYWEPLGSTPLKLNLPSGDHRIVVQKQNFMTREEVIRVDDDQSTVEVEVTLVSQDALFNVTGRQWQRRGVYFMLGSIPFAAGGAALFVLSNDRFDEAGKIALPEGESRAEDLRDTAYNYRTAAIASSAVGGAALVTGLVFYFAGMDSGETALKPYVGPKSVGLAGVF